MVTKYGCKDKIRSTGYWARIIVHDGTDDYPPEYGWKFVPDTMTPECQYRKSTPDPRCEGCTCP